MRFCRSRCPYMRCKFSRRPKGSRVPPLSTLHRTLPTPHSVLSSSPHTPPFLLKHPLTPPSPSIVLLHQQRRLRRQLRHHRLRLPMQHLAIQRHPNHGPRLRALRLRPPHRRRSHFRRRERVLLRRLRRRRRTRHNHRHRDDDG